MQRSIGEDVMSEADNTQTAKDAYAAFGRGDIAAVLGVMTDDIEWVFPGPAVLPNAGTFTGPEAVGAWFGTLGATIEFQVFEPREFIAQGDKLVALVHIENTVRSTGGKVVVDEAHLWTFRGGKVSGFRVFTDTAAAASAFSA
jgi:ketosteroid isomerase-like protein